jgi:hypothetical protein
MKSHRRRVERMRREYRENANAMRERLEKYARAATCANLPTVRVIKDWHQDEHGCISRQVGSGHE